MTPCSWPASSAIVLSDYDTAALTELQLRTLRDFVGLGGLLVLGGGAAWTRTLASLPDASCRCDRTVRRKRGWRRWPRWWRSSSPDRPGYRFDYQAPPKPGRTVFRMVNAGKGDHMASLNLLDDDFPPIDAQLRGTERRPVASSVELPVSSSGDIQTFAVDLVPGQRYAFLCHIVDPPTSEVHALKGMNSESAPRCGSPARRRRGT